MRYKCLVTIDWTRLRQVGDELLVPCSWRDIESIRSRISRQNAKPTSTVLLSAHLYPDWENLQGVRVWVRALKEG